MGYSYGINPATGHQALSCDQCGASNGEAASRGRTLAVGGEVMAPFPYLLRFRIDFDTMRLYNNRVSVWFSVQLGRRTFWISRWDTERVDPDKPGQIYRGRVMTWYWGVM